MFWGLLWVPGSSPCLGAGGFSRAYGEGCASGQAREGTHGDRSLKQQAFRTQGPLLGSQTSPGGPGPGSGYIATCLRAHLGRPPSWRTPGRPQSPCPPASQEAQRGAETYLRPLSCSEPPPCTMGPKDSPLHAAWNCWSSQEAQRRQRLSPPGGSPPPRPAGLAAGTGLNGRHCRWTRQARLPQAEVKEGRAAGGSSGWSYKASCLPQPRMEAWARILGPARQGGGTSSGLGVSSPGLPPAMWAALPEAAS